MGALDTEDNDDESERVTTCFHFNRANLTDPDPSMSPEEVKKMYASSGTCSDQCQRDWPGDQRWCKQSTPSRQRSVPKG